MLRRISFLLALVALGVGLAAAPRHLTSRPAVAPDYTNFESGQVKPAVLTPNGDRLLVVNTPDSRLSVFDLTGEAPHRMLDIPVGLEPVTVAALNDSIAWVVNNLSDDISIVSLSQGHVIRTLHVGDEPNDVVFAGAGPVAYVSVSQEDAVKVYDTSTLALMTTIPIPGRMPRALGRTAAGDKVYVGVFHAGNRTSVLSAAEVADSILDDPDFPRDPSNKLGHPAPAVAGIVQENVLSDWRDEYGKLWNSKIKYSLPDADVAEINTTSNLVSRTFFGIGSIIYNLAVSPFDGRLAVASTEARNLLRYEPKVRGYMVDTRVTYVNQTGVAAPRLLSPQINFDVLPAPPIEPDSALGIPTFVTFQTTGRAYITSLATDKIGVLNPLSSGSGGNMVARIPVVEGPTGIVLDEPRGRMYVVGRFRNELQTLSLADFTELDRRSIGMDPTPDELINGRRFLYKGRSSGHGDQACATCHIFGDMDNMVWDLGDPFGAYLPGFVPARRLRPPEGADGDAVAARHAQHRAVPLARRPRELRRLQRRVPQPDGPRVPAARQRDDGVHRLRRADRLPAEPLSEPRPHLPRSLGADAQRGAGPTGVHERRRRRRDDLRQLSHGDELRSRNQPAMINDLRGTSQDLKVPQLRNLYKKTGFTDQIGAVNKRGFGYSTTARSTTCSSSCSSPASTSAPTPPSPTRPGATSRRSCSPSTPAPRRRSAARSHSTARRTRRVRPASTRCAPRPNSTTAT